MNIIGISAFYHDSACCLIKDGALIAAAQEERFSRLKNDPGLPVKSFKHCLKEGKISINDVDRIAFYENPVKKLSRQLWCGYNYLDPELTKKMDPRRPEKEIRDKLGYEGKIEFVDHHLSHAASSFLFSGYESSAILTVDGVGEWATTTYATGEQNSIRIMEEVCFPDSLGLLYSAITNYLGFNVNSGEYKVMGLAPYGKPVYLDLLLKVIKPGTNGQFSLNMDYFDFTSGTRMFTEKLEALLGNKPRKKESELLAFHLDIAKSLQVLLQDVLLEKSKYLHSITGKENLCLAGGVALNCVANGYILRNGPFKRLFVPPAANDAGGAQGAAAVVYCQLSGKKISTSPLKTTYLGASFSDKEIEIVLKNTSLKGVSYQGRREELLNETAKRLADGKVIGWFQGRAEFGPRALGSRSILADPRNPEMRDRINQMVKKRESFRPFAPVIPEEKCAIYFELDHPSPFMLETCSVKPFHDLPAITHVDNSARVQTVNRRDNAMLADLLSAFEKITDCPILLNTSFNVRGEPIVNSPADALICFSVANLDALVIGDTLIDRNQFQIDELNKLINCFDSTWVPVRTDRGVYTFI
ncbi:carbamoyltransferase family protein [Niastella populi]|uniref:Carbamoyltransferase n=1 Tax=Niastella populi TaxID=550983 RepID=A0A1V9EJU5_9BACT|nr:carbamoyltransferase N-terminal domain-containing protein [Niastella populi]OQP46413.1 carbamoyltransferase [Niastella populi]